MCLIPYGRRYFPMLRAAFVTVVMQWIADTYAPFGIWNILLPLTVLFFLLFAFLTLDTLGKMLARGSIPAL